ncbi:MAG: hypothetical protein KatS3mg068_1162 [Candidatus Sericytochromatia bacterium]|nr:MAG: hypothetical protein KatS3mg068_1162 [Candidatus Sericytochromatia bacterium]
MKSLKILLSSLLIISSLNYKANAEENQENDDFIPQRLTNYKGLGITLGLLSSMGISYRTFLTEKIGVKATGIGFYDQSQGFWSVGFQGMYVMSENKDTKFYFLAGISNFSSRRTTYYPTPTVSNNYGEDVFIPRKEDNQPENYLSLGGGIGAEIGTFTPGFTLAVEVPIVFTFRNMSLYSLYPIPQISLIYNF